LIEKSRFKDRIATANISASALYHVSSALLLECLVIRDALPAPDIMA
jgi:hypothetical protein